MGAFRPQRGFARSIRDLLSSLDMSDEAALQLVARQGVGKPEDLDGLVDGAAKVTRLLDNNPRPMSRADMRAIYEQLI